MKKEITLANGKKFTIEEKDGVMTYCTHNSPEVCYIIKPERQECIKLWLTDLWDRGAKFRDIR